MKTAGLVEEVRKFIAASGGTVGFVPTMGALHEGHASLIEQAVIENDLVVVSVYVNPTQFNNSEDLKNYPLAADEDLVLLESLGVDLVFTPTYDVIYPDNFRYKVVENEFSNELCGGHRAGHFDGVLTVVLKLLNIIQPDKAYFGEKDYQQFLLVQQMAAALFLDVQIVPVPTVRESDGLAMSSRNRNLDCESRRKAPLMYELLNSDFADDQVASQLADAGFDVDYVVTKFNRRFAAASLGLADKKVRLIDNVKRNQ